MTTIQTKQSDKRLIKLIKQITYWRKNKQSASEPIPEDILLDAGKLAGDYTIGFVAKQLNLNHGRLKPYYQQSAENSVSATLVEPTLVEIPRIQLSNNKCSFEIKQPNGIQLSAEVTQQELFQVIETFVRGNVCYN